MNHASTSIRILSIIAAASILSCKKQDRTRSQAPIEPSVEIQEPERISRSGTAPKDLELPELPPDADSLPEITVRLEGANKRIVSRSTHRIHLAMPDRNQEWLFIRNPIDGRRVTGILIDHEHHVLIDYPETDLRVEGIARGWANLISLDASMGEVTQGIDHKLLLDPAKRFPDYGDFDIADWREELHENGHDHAGHDHSTSGASSR